MRKLFGPGIILYLFSSVVCVVCLYDGLSLRRLRLLSEEKLKGDGSTACSFSLNLNFQISVSCLIRSAPQPFYPHLLVSSNLFSSPRLDSALYLRPRQSIKVLNGGVYLVMNIHRDNKHKAGLGGEKRYQFTAKSNIQYGIMQ